MHKVKFEIECKNPEIVMKAVQTDDISEVKYGTENNKLIFEISSECLKTFTKIVYSTCNRVQLSIETVNKFAK